MVGMHDVVKLVRFISFWVCLRWLLSVVVFLFRRWLMCALAWFGCWFIVRLQLAVISGICSVASDAVGVLLMSFSVDMIGAADEAVVVVVDVMAAVVAVGVASTTASSLPLVCCLTISFLRLAMSFGLQNDFNCIYINLQSTQISQDLPDLYEQNTVEGVQHIQHWIHWRWLNVNGRQIGSDFTIRANCVHFLLQNHGLVGEMA